MRRAVLISSGAGHKEKFSPYWGPYAASKAALDAIVRTYAAETVNVSSVKVMSTNPGPLRTRLRAAATASVAGYAPGHVYGRLEALLEEALA